MQAMNRFVEYFGAYMDEAGRLALADAAVVGMSTYHDRRELHIALQLPALVETAELERCADQIAAQMGLEKAVLTPHYASAAFSADCLPSLIANIRRHHAEVNGFFKDAKATVNGNTLHIDLQYGGREVLLAKGTDKLLAQEIHKLFDLELAVEFVEAKTYDIEAAVRSAVAEKQEAEKQKKEEAEKQVEHRPMQGGLPLYGDTVHGFFGKPIRELPKPMNEVKTDDGYITVWGDVLCSEARETKRGGNKIFSFNISDYTSSMTVKMFDSNKVMDPVINKIQSAKTVMVSGMYQYDNYAGEYVLRANSLATVTKMEEMDTAPEKRVELHMHTSLSEMDAISSPTSLVKRAAKWGHKAVAITDHGVVQALPEACKAAKSAGIKLLCGMEGYLVDDEKYPDFMNMKLKDFPRYHIIFLIRTLAGRKVLY